MEGVQVCMIILITTLVATYSLFQSFTHRIRQKLRVWEHPRILGAQTKLLAVTNFEIVLSECLSVSTEWPGLREWEERRRLLHDFCLIICQSATVSTL